MKRGIQSQEWAVRVCMMLILVFGIVMSMMIPPWQIPDENAHIRMIGEGIGNPNLEELFLQDMDMDCHRIHFNSEEKVDIEQWKAAMTAGPSYSRMDCMPKGFHISSIKHLPAMVGILLGVLLHLPTFWVLELGELCSLMFYVVICWQAVRLMPIKKELLLMFMVFPITLQQAASVNYDAVLLPLCFLFVSYIFYMRCEKEQLGWKEAVLAILLLGLITYIKLPYVLLGLLVFIIPIEKICLRLGTFQINGETIRRFRIPAIVVLIIVFAAVLYLVRNNFWVQLVGGMTLEWRQTAHLFKATAQTFWRYLIVSSVGQFGYLDSQLPFWFTWATYLLTAVIAVWGRGETKSASFEMKGRTKVYLWIIFMLLSYLTVLSMVNHTIKVVLFGSEGAAESYNLREAIYAIPYIGGLQGRYFIPFLALPFLGLPHIGREVKWKLWIPVVYLIVAMVFTVRVLYGRYWA